MLGLIQLPWWGYLIFTLVVTQITILSVTIYLHRAQAHRALVLHPIASHFFRFWLWLTTGMVTKEWAAIHRKHHARVETAEDPHSPQVKGIKTLLFEGAELYRKEAGNAETMIRFGEGTPDDWIEKHIYTKHSALGIVIMLLTNLILFGPIGLTIWACQMAWIPFFAAGIINGIGHYWGYRNFECKDASRNITPIAFFLGGEELHNNHHAYATSAKFSAKWWEFDMGWLVIRTLQFFGLATPKRVMATPKLLRSKKFIDHETLQAIISYRFQVMAGYAKEVIFPSLNIELKKAKGDSQKLLSQARTLLVRETSIMKGVQQKKLAFLLENFHSLKVVYQFRLTLQDIWNKRTSSQKDLVFALQEWCRQAEETGIEALSIFSARLKMYVPR